MLFLSPATLAMLARRSSESRGHSKRRTEAPQARQQGERITGKKGPQVEEWYFLRVPLPQIPNTRLPINETDNASDLFRQILIKIPTVINQYPILGENSRQRVVSNRSVNHLNRSFAAIDKLCCRTFGLDHIGRDPHPDAGPAGAVTTHTFSASVTWRGKFIRRSRWPGVSGIGRGQYAAYAEVGDAFSS